MAERGNKGTPQRGDTAPTHRQQVVHDVVVSYSRSDGARVKPFVFELQQAGVSIWIDQKDIDGAQPWGQKIAEAIDSCKVLLFMASATSVTRQGVIREVAVAYDAEKAVLPVHLEPVALPSALRYQLAGIQHIEMFEDADVQASLNSVLRALRGLGVEVTPRTQRERLAASAAHDGFENSALVSAERPIVRDTPSAAIDHFADEIAPSAAAPTRPADRARPGDRRLLLLGVSAAIVLVALVAIFLH